MGGDSATTQHEMQSYEKVRLVPWKAGVRYPRPVTYGTAAGGSTFVFVRLIVKLSTNWHDTTSTHIAGAPC